MVVSQGLGVLWASLFARGWVVFLWEDSLVTDDLCERLHLLLGVQDEGVQ